MRVSIFFSAALVSLSLCQALNVEARQRTRPGKKSPLRARLRLIGDIDEDTGRVDARWATLNLSEVTGMHLDPRRLGERIGRLNLRFQAVYRPRHGQPDPNLVSFANYGRRNDHPDAVKRILRAQTGHVPADALRVQGVRQGRFFREKIRRMDEAFATYAQVIKGGYYFRGEVLASGSRIPRVGAIVTTKEYFSVGLEPATAYRFIDPSRTKIKRGSVRVLTILDLTHQGARALWMAAMYNSTRLRVDPGVRGEHELNFGRGTAFKTQRVWKTQDEYGDVHIRLVSP
jgi:hypothetical protein